MARKDPENENIELLMHALEGMNRTLELQALLKKSMESAKLLMNSDASSLMLMDEMTGELSVSIPTGPVDKKIKGLSIPKGKGISGWVAEKKKPFLSNNPEKSDKFWKDLSPDFKTRNLLCVPLITPKKELIGVLQVLNKHNGEDYDQDDLQLMEVFAAFVTTAIQKVREVDDIRKSAEKQQKYRKHVHEALRKNLFTVSSFLQIEAVNTEDRITSDILRSASSRVLVLANAHYLLKEDSLSKEIDIGVFVNEIFASVTAIFAREDKDIKITLEAEEVFLTAERTFTLGLLINEVLILLLRYAFNEQDEGEIIVDLEVEGDYLMVRIIDDGKGLRIDLAELESNIDVTSILMTLASALKSEISIFENEGDGTTFLIKIQQLET